MTFLRPCLILLVSSFLVTEAERAPVNREKPKKQLGIGGVGYFIAQKPIPLSQSDERVVVGHFSESDSRDHRPTSMSNSFSFFESIDQSSSSPSFYNLHHFWYELPERRPFYDPIGRQWRCPMQELLDSSDFELSGEVSKDGDPTPIEDEGSNFQTLRENETASEAQSSKTRRADPNPPLSVWKAKMLDTKADTRNFNDVFQNITGITIPREKFARGSFAFQRRFSISASQTDGIDHALPAFCQPEVTTVELDLPDRPGVFFYPTCTRVKRCGGCCSHELLECQPVDKAEIKLKVTKTAISQRTGSIEYKGEEIVEVEQHNSCECDCRIKEEDCHPGQIYLANECRCMCRNRKQMKQCQADDRFWDPSECVCKCKNVHECSTGMNFNNETCRCERVYSLRSLLINNN